MVPRVSGAHVVLQEDDDDGEDGVSVSRVLVNGVDVGTMAAVPKVKVGIRGERTTVTLTLAPAYLEIKGENGQPAKSQSFGFAPTKGADDGDG
jgi:hypothetical protein